MDAQLQYPIGKFKWDGSVADERRRNLIDKIERAPALLRAAVAGLSPEQLDTPYRPEGWTVRQVVHHVPDSHLNSYVRCKLALTENDPVIKPYDEACWANLADSSATPLDVSLALLESLHRRWVLLLRSLSAKDCARTFRHPERGPMSLDQNIALYAWHGEHHVAHITSLRQRQGWDAK